VKAVLFPGKDNKEGAAKTRREQAGRRKAGRWQARARRRVEGRGRRTMSEHAARLRAEGLTKSFVGRRVVDDVTIEVHAGEVVGCSVRTAPARRPAST
jgi:hypothetical protein